MKDWEKEFDSICTKAHQESSFNLNKLRKDFEQAAKKYFQYGEMHDGDEYRVPMSAGGMYFFMMNQDHIDIYSTVDIQDGEQEYNKEILVSKEEALRGDYSKLDTAAAINKIQFTYMGERFPEELISLLNKLEPGSLITFNQGGSYICLEHGKSERDKFGDTSNTVSLKKVFEGDICKDNLHYLYNKENDTVDLGYRPSIQKFYNKNSKISTERMEFKMTTLDEPRRIVEEIEDRVRREGGRFFRYGDICIHAVASKTDNEVLWYDTDGQRVDREDVIILNGLIQNRMLNREYHRSASGVFDLHNDKEFEKEMEKYSLSGEYDKIYDRTIEYVTKESGILTLEFENLAPMGDGFSYIPEKLSFTNENGITKCYRARYEDNDPKKNIASISEVSKGEFMSICKQIYDKNYDLLYTRSEELVLVKYKFLELDMTDTQKRIIKSVTDKRLEGINMAPMKFTVSDKAVIDLLQNYVKSARSLNVRDIVKRIKEGKRYYGTKSNIRNRDMLDMLR